MTPMTIGSERNSSRLFASGNDTKPALLNPDTPWNRPCQTASQGGYMNANRTASTRNPIS